MAWTRRRLMASMGGLPLVLAGRRPGRADEPFPTRPVRAVVASSPGGGADTTSRIIGARLAGILGQQIVIDNRPGANGIIGTELVAKAAPDGYTLLYAFTGHSVNPAMYTKLPFDPVRDFTPISLVLLVPNVLMVHPSLPVHSVPELIALAKAQPGQISYATSGNGSAQHLSAELFKSMAGLDMVGVPYRGGGPALIDLVAGQVKLYFGNMTSAMAHIQGGKVRALAVTGDKRSAVLPELPTVAEAGGLAGYSVYEWNGLMGPAGLPAPIVARLHDTLVETLKTPAVAERLEALGADVVGSTPDAFRHFVDAEIAKWDKVVKAAGIHAD